MTRARGGFTLVELMVALLVLSVLMLGSAATTDQLIRRVLTDEMHVTALQHAEDRLQLILLDPAYGELEGRYAGVEDGLDDAPGLRRTTLMERVAEEPSPGRRIEFVRVTVRVEGPLLATPVERSAVVGAP